MSRYRAVLLGVVGAAALLLFSGTNPAFAGGPPPDDAVPIDTDGNGKADTYTWSRQRSDGENRYTFTDSDEDGVLEDDEPRLIEWDFIDDVPGFRQVQPEGRDGPTTKTSDRDRDGNPESSAEYSATPRKIVLINWDHDSDGRNDARSERRSTDTGLLPTRLTWTDDGGGEHAVTDTNSNGRVDPGEVHGERKDLDNDGVYDTDKLDVDGDNKWDQVARDTDGKPGLDVRYQLNENGDPTTITYLGPDGETEWEAQDLNGDGIVNEVVIRGVGQDVVVVDTNNNGRVDPGEERQAIVYDGEGQRDEVWVDGDGDGEWDEVSYEFVDGKPRTVERFESPQTLSSDTDGDGVYDTFRVDTDGDGEYDSDQRDTDGDGEPDVELFDDDGDGKFDRAIPIGNVVFDPDQPWCKNLLFDETDGYTEINLISPTIDPSQFNNCWLMVRSTVCPTQEIEVRLSATMPGFGVQNVFFGNSYAIDEPTGQQHVDAFDRGDTGGLARFFREVLSHITNSGIGRFPNLDIGTTSSDRPGNKVVESPLAPRNANDEPGSAFFLQAGSSFLKPSGGRLELTVDESHDEISVFEHSGGLWVGPDRILGVGILPTRAVDEAGAEVPVVVLASIRSGMGPAAYAGYPKGPTCEALGTITASTGRDETSTYGFSGSVIVADMTNAIETAVAGLVVSIAPAP